MALYHKWDVKNGFAYVLQFFSLISDGLGGVSSKCSLGCVQRLNIYVKPTRQIYSWQKSLWQTRLKNEKYLENEDCTAKEVKTTTHNTFFLPKWTLLHMQGSA